MHVCARASAPPWCQFLVAEKNFSEERVRKAVARINATKGKANQGRMESFFTALPKPKAEAPAGACACVGRGCVEPVEQGSTGVLVHACGVWGGFGLGPQGLFPLWRVRAP